MLSPHHRSLVLFIVGMAGWLYILTKSLLEASRINASEGTVAGQKAFNALRLIVTVGWAIYPLGYIWVRGVEMSPPSISSTTQPIS